MKSAFWAPERECGVTANLAAISVAALHLNQRRTVLMENHYHSNNLSKYLIPERMELIRETEEEYYGHGTKDCLLHQLERKTNRKRVGASTIELIQDCLFYIPQNRLADDFFDYEFRWNQYPNIERYEQEGQHILIDTKTNESLSTKLILDEAEVIIVSLKQDTTLISDFMKKYSSMLNKTFFVISNYRNKKGLSLRNIQKEFHIPSNRIGIIPHNIEFESALSEGRTIEFINRYIRCESVHMNYYFMRELLKTTKKIIRFSKRAKYIRMCTENVYKEQQKEVV